MLSLTEFRCMKWDYDAALRLAVEHYEQGHKQGAMDLLALLRQRETPILKNQRIGDEQERSQTIVTKRNHDL